MKEKVSIVTGGGTGVGKVIASRFALEGARVIIADINQSFIESTIDEIQAAGGKASGFTVDITRRDQIEKLMRDVVGQHGRIDILVNNAGITRYRPFSTMTSEDWDVVLNLDLKGVFFCSQLVAPHLIERGYGKIVNIGSAAGTGTTPHHTAGSPGGSSAYASAKAGVIQLTKTLARELGPHGINVNCVAPGFFLTALTSATRNPQEVEEHIEFRKKVTVLGRPGRLEELASAVLFLASDEASFITGHTLYVDGGRIDRM